MRCLERTVKPGASPTFQRSAIFAVQTLTALTKQISKRALATATAGSTSQQKAWQENEPEQQPRLLTMANLNPCIKKMEYAVRGPLVIRAVEIEKELESGVKKPFKNVIRANIGDCHAMGQQPITFLRQVVGMCTLPELSSDPRFPTDVRHRAKRVLDDCKGSSIGSYSDSSGLEVIRKDIANYIRTRDKGVPSNPDDIVMCTGASDGIKSVMKLLRHASGAKQSGVMVPIPQYPLYSATLAEYNMYQIGYYLEEKTNWGLEIEELQRAIDEARKHCVPRAIVVINPGNPTGQVLSRRNIEDVIKFAKKEGLYIFADEVYQDNIYTAEKEFHSFKKVLMELGLEYRGMELASFHSTSKGYMGECGMRGGYAEVLNMDSQVRQMFLKSISAKLCPTVSGQAAMECVVNPPQIGEPSYKDFMQEKTGVLKSLAFRAKMVYDRLNARSGITCNVVEGSMYAFPRIMIPEKAIELCKRENQEPDEFYAMSLLESKGICVVPGSGFGQVPGTHHFRMTILPQPEILKDFLDRLEEFHSQFTELYS